MVGGGGDRGCGCGRGLSVMSLKSSGHGSFESKYQREGEASRPGEERWRDNRRERQSKSEK